jgi:EmrB/QacA subfamily drug resistance transporter
MKIDFVSAQQEKSLNILLWLVACGFFMQTLDATIVNTAIPSMAISLQESPLRMQSVVVVYSLAMAILIPASGWLSDRYGTRRVYLGAIVLFVVGSLLCAASKNLAQILLARIVQGAGGALLLPVGRLSILRSFPRSHYLAAMSFIAVPGMTGPLIGPFLGGWLVEYATWHWIFLINLPVGCMGLACGLIYLKGPALDEDKKFDSMGYTYLALSLICFVLGVDGHSSLELSGLQIGLILGASLVFMALYIKHAMSHDLPLFAPHLFNTLTLKVGILGNLISRLGSSSIPYLLPLMFQVCLGYAPVQSGLMMLPPALSGMVTKRLTTGIIVKYGYKKVLLINTLIVGGLMALMALAQSDTPLWAMLTVLVLFGAANSLQFTAMNTITVIDLNGQDASAGNALLAMSQMLALGLGVACAGTLLNTFNLFHAQTGLDKNHALESFHETLLCMASITIGSTLIYSKLKNTS